MKKLLTILLILPFVIACSDDKETETIVLTGITLLEVDKELNIGDEYQMRVSTEPQNTSVNFKWTSSDNKVATISDKGMLKILSDGLVSISASYGSLSSSVDLVVNRKQDYTSFVFVFENEFAVIQPNCVTAYKNNQGHYKLIAKLGDIDTSKGSKEIRIDNPSFSEIYLFSDLFDEPRIFNDVYKIEKNKKNILVVKKYTSGTKVDNTDPTQYPID